MESEIRQAEERLRHACAENDVTALDTLIDDQTPLRCPPELVIRKIDHLALHRSDAQRFARLDLDEVFI